MSILLIGAVANMRPDLFKAMVAAVPFVDVINTMLDPSIPLTVIEYEEWGNPNEKDYFDYMMTYSPYDNVKAQELAFMLQTIGPNADQSMLKLILRDICRLRKMPELAKQIEEWEPQPDPLDQQIKQLELAKLQKELQKMDSEIVENFAGAELDKAKAREAGSKADLSDLDFVEQESGVKQEREKELQGEQARANMVRDRHKAELDKYLQKYKAQA